MPASEFSEWKAFQKLDPDPDIKRQFENASLVSKLVELMTGKKRNLKDYLLSYSKGVQRSSWQDIKNRLRLWKQGRDQARKDNDASSH